MFLLNMFTPSHLALTSNGQLTVVPVMPKPYMFHPSTIDKMAVAS
jgi:hypothetical protein